MASSNQGGSILSFLIIGGVLTVLLIGGAYAVQRRVANSTSTPTAPVATQPDAPAADEKKVAVDQNKDAAKQETAKKEEVAKQEAAKKEAAKPAVPAPVTPPAATELPQTGLTESVSAILGLGLLTGMATAYVRSRRRTATL